MKKSRKIQTEEVIEEQIEEVIEDKPEEVVENKTRRR